jgi:hypothetical protein
MDLVTHMLHRTFLNTKTKFVYNSEVQTAEVATHILLLVRSASPMHSFTFLLICLLSCLNYFVIICSFNSDCCSLISCSGADCSTSLCLQYPSL